MQLPPQAEPSRAAVAAASRLRVLIDENCKLSKYLKKTLNTWENTLQLETDTCWILVQ